MNTYVGPFVLFNIHVLIFHFISFVLDFFKYEERYRLKYKNLNNYKEKLISLIIVLSISLTNRVYTLHLLYKTNSVEQV